MEVALEAGAEDLKLEDEAFVVTTRRARSTRSSARLEGAGLAPSEATVVMEPQSVVELEGKKAEQCLKLLEALEDHDDVQQVFANVAVVDAAASE